MKGLFLVIIWVGFATPTLYAHSRAVDDVIMAIEDDLSWDQRWPNFNVKRWVYQLYDGVYGDVLSNQSKNEIKSYGACLLAIGSGALYVSTYCSAGGVVAISACAAAVGSVGISVCDALFR